MFRSLAFAGCRDECAVININPRGKEVLISSMKKIKLFLLFAALTFFVKAGEISRFVLWYNAPAKNWNEALPIGNGNLGAMVFGRAEQERIALNEETLWTGGPAEQNPNPDAPRHLSKVRQLLFEGRNDEASRVMRKMQGPNTQMYQPLGDLFIFQQSQSKATDYYRDLDLATAITTTRFKQDGVTFTREMFVSAPDSVLVFRLTANQKGALNIRLAVHHELAYETVLEGNDLVLKAKARIGSDEDGNRKSVLYEDAIGDKGMFFQLRVRVISCDGEVVPADSMLSINNATEAVVLLSGATSFNGFRNSPVAAGKDPQAATLRILRSLRGKSFDEIKTDHLADYQTYFKRVDLTLSDAPIPQIPTDQRLSDYKKGIVDLHLEELYFQFGRYLLISCSRPGGIAANLQGLWCESIDPPWRSNFTTNINLQMNYWLALSLNMQEMYEPLLTQIEHMAFNGLFTAKNYYHMSGWAAHHSSDIWAQTNPVGEGSGDPKWANWALGSPWLSQHLYDYYRFTLDEEFLREKAYPIMKGATDFCLDWLVEKDGYLVTAPSTSPDLDKNGKKVGLTIASSIDMEIIRDLFTNMIEASQLLNIDSAYRALLMEKRAKLLPLNVGKEGNLQEWYEDFEDVEPTHRHVSHLLDTHLPFQIDGDLGSIAGISEFFLQSQLGELQLLPALPEAWKDGSVKGLKARGAFDVDIIWKNSKLLRAEITSRKGAPCVVRVNQSIKIVGAKVKKQKVKIQGKVQYIYRFLSECGKTYYILGR
jgi:alpha-L-fucosidase 2